MKGNILVDEQSDLHESLTGEVLHKKLQLALLSKKNDCSCEQRACLKQTIMERKRRERIVVRRFVKEERDADVDAEQQDGDEQKPA